MYTHTQTQTKTQTQTQTQTQTDTHTPCLKQVGAGDGARVYIRQQCAHTAAAAPQLSEFVLLFHEASSGVDETSEGAPAQRGTLSLSHTCSKGYPTRSTAAEKLRARLRGWCARKCLHVTTSFKKKEREATEKKKGE